VVITMEAMAVVVVAAVAVLVADLDLAKVHTLTQINLKMMNFVLPFERFFFVGFENSKFNFRTTLVKI
jgi:hypothetical protein